MYIIKLFLKKTIEKISKTKSWFFEKINKIDKPLARLTKKKAQIKIRNERGYITAGTTEIYKIIRDYYEQLNASKLDDPEEMDRCLEIFFEDLIMKKQKI